ncbi:MAG: acylphosphatase [Pseudobdellovibrionaceae bacterium]
MTYHIFVSGRVQGVGYRRFAQKQAEALSLPGWTRNLLDGRVEIVVSGAEKDLDRYCEILKKGPAFSLVREVLVKSVDEEAGQQGFEIRPDPEMK